MNLKQMKNQLNAIKIALLSLGKRVSLKIKLNKYKNKDIMITKLIIKGNFNLMICPHLSKSSIRTN